MVLPQRHSLLTWLREQLGAVQSTARDAHGRDYQVCILQGACAAADKARHPSSMQLLSSIARPIQLATPESF